MFGLNRFIKNAAGKLHYQPLIHKIQFPSTIFQLISRIMA